MASFDFQGASDLGSRLSFMNSCRAASVELLQIIHDMPLDTFERQVRKVIFLLTPSKYTEGPDFYLGPSLDYHPHRGTVGLIFGSSCTQDMTGLLLTMSL